jgi:hypothetical protein
MQYSGCILLRIHLPRTPVNKLDSWGLTVRPSGRISMSDNTIATTPNSRVAPGAGDPHGPKIRGVNRWAGQASQRRA